LTRRLSFRHEVSPTDDRFVGEGSSEIFQSVAPRLRDPQVEISAQRQDLPYPAAKEKKTKN
jgi:hypothetical protein